MKTINKMKKELSDCMKAEWVVDPEKQIKNEHSEEGNSEESEGPEPKENDEISRFLELISETLKDNEVEVIWKVQNLDDREMVYSIGAHTAFRCPLVQGEEFSDCYLTFNQQEDNVNMPLNSKGQFLKEQGEARLQGEQLALNYGMFAGDALAYKGLKSDVVTICSHKSDKKVSMEAKNFPFWGFWTPAQGGAPFLCLEPWQGHADYEGYNGEFADREGSLKLEPGKTQSFHYTIRIG